MRRRTLSVGVLGLVGVAALYAHFFASPGCSSEAAQLRVEDILRKDFKLTGIFINDIHTLSGGFFSYERECSAQIAEIRGNITAADMPWREIRYSVALGDAADNPAVTVQVGGGQPLAEPHPSFWDRLHNWL